MTREELKEQIDEFMQQYANEEIDGDTYAQKMMELQFVELRKSEVGGYTHENCNH
ncbi:MAG: hypothetical protein JTJ23_03870 [Fusicatenibacter saccharivorans]|uniref:Uncharacterized protein n=1 Tax=Fusicatenibacter saccharivorans TaxID=1150298 RepID=A0A938Z5T8_9FIRM|nr:hypothetical protein [Fusicatenibacter saccharivorans]